MCERVNGGLRRARSGVPLLTCSVFVFIYLFRQVVFSICFGTDLIEGLLERTTL